MGAPWGGGEWAGGSWTNDPVLYSGSSAPRGRTWSRDGDQYPRAPQCPYRPKGKGDDDRGGKGKGKGDDNDPVWSGWRGSAVGPRTLGPSRASGSGDTPSASTWINDRGQVDSMRNQYTINDFAAEQRSARRHDEPEIDVARIQAGPFNTPASTVCEALLRLARNCRLGLEQSSYDRNVTQHVQDEQIPTWYPTNLKDCVVKTIGDDAIDPNKGLQEQDINSLVLCVPHGPEVLELHEWARQSLDQQDPLWQRLVGRTHYRRPVGRFSSVPDLPLPVEDKPTPWLPAYYSEGYAILIPDTPDGFHQLKVDDNGREVTWWFGLENMNDQRCLPRIIPIAFTGWWWAQKAMQVYMFNRTAQEKNKPQLNYTMPDGWTVDFYIDMFFLQ